MKTQSSFSLKRAVLGGIALFVATIAILTVVGIGNKVYQVVEQEGTGILWSPVMLTIKVFEPLERRP